jgi:hypothetical protein
MMEDLVELYSMIDVQAFFHDLGLIRLIGVNDHLEVKIGHQFIEVFEFGLQLSPGLPGHFYESQSRASLCRELVRTQHPYVKLFQFLLAQLVDVLNLFPEQQDLGLLNQVSRSDVELVVIVPGHEVPGLVLQVILGLVLLTVPDDILKALGHQEGNFLLDGHLLLAFLKVGFGEIDQPDRDIVGKIPPVKEAQVIILNQPEEFMKLCPLHEKGD